MIDTPERTLTTRRRPPLEKATLFHCKRDKLGLCTHPECAPVVLEPGSHAVRILERLTEPTGEHGTLSCMTREDRARVRKLIADGRLCALAPSEIADDLGLHRSEVSRQLKAMRSAGYVTRDRDGRHLYYRLTDSGVGAIGFAHRNQRAATELLTIRYEIIPQTQDCYALVRQIGGRTDKLTLGTKADCEAAFKTVEADAVQLSATEQQLKETYGSKVGAALDGEFAES